MAAGRAFTRTTTGDFYAPSATGAGAFGKILGARLIAGAAAAAAQIVDGNGNVLVNLAALATGSDECDIEVQFEGKVTLQAISGAGAAATIYLA